MSLYNEIGGAPAVAAAVSAFYDRVTADPELGHYFESVDMNRLMAHQRAFIGAALGGPDAYQGRSMTYAHADLNITSEAFDKVVGHLVAVLGGLGVRAEAIESIGATLAPLKEDIVSE